MRTRIGKASSVFQRLHPIWKCGKIIKEIKLRLYSSIVVPTATSACETWKTTATATKMINVFRRRCLKRILRISWHDHITNDEVMTRSGQTALHDIVATKRRRFIGHILRLPPTRLASLAIERRPEDGKRNIGRPKRTWQDTLKRRSRGDGHGLQRQDDCCQRSCQLETNRRPMFRTELEKLSISK